MAPSVEKNFWTTSLLDIEGRIVTVYNWPSDRPVYLRRVDQNTPRDYVQVPYFSLNDPKISKGRGTVETFDAELRRFIKQAEEIFRQGFIMVVRCKEVPWLVGFISNRCVLVPAISFINPQDMQETTPPNLIERGHACNSASYGEVQYVGISGEVEKYKRIMKIGSEKQPASAEDIRDIQEQLAQTCTNPNLTLFESHTIEFPHLAFLQKWDDLWHKNHTQKASCTDMSLLSQTNNFESFVARMAWIYRTFNIKRGGTMILPSHEPRKLLFGWTFINRENDECNYNTIGYTAIKRAALENKDCYCGKMAQSILDHFEKYELSHLELNRYWNIYDLNSYCDLLVFPLNQHREG